MDACIHTQPYMRAECDLDFRLYIIELAIEFVEEMESVDLSRGKNCITFSMVLLSCQIKLIEDLLSLV